MGRACHGDHLGRQVDTRLFQTAIVEVGGDASDSASDIEHPCVFHGQKMFGERVEHRAVNRPFERGGDGRADLSGVVRSGEVVDVARRGDDVRFGMSHFVRVRGGDLRKQRVCLRGECAGRAWLTSIRG